MALTTQITALSWLLQSRYHLAIDDIALVWAAGPLAGIVGQLAVGHASDRSWALGGRRRPWLLLSGVLTALALVALLHLADVAAWLGGVPLVLLAGLVALLLDVAINMGLNPARALIADLVPAGPARSLAFAHMQTVSGVLGVAITLVGALLGNVAMIVAAAVLTLPLTALPALLVAEPRVLAETVAPPPPLTLPTSLSMLLPIAPAAALAVLAWLQRLGGGSMGMALPLMATAGLTGIIALSILRGGRRDQTGLARHIFLAQGLSWIGIFCMFVFLAPVAAERLPAMPAEQLGRDIAVALGLFNLVAALAPLLLLMPLCRHWRRAHVHAAAMALMGLCLAAIGGLVSSVIGLWACMAVAGIGWGALVSLPYVMFCDRVSAGQLGLLLGLFNLSVVIPQLVVSLGLGALAPALSASGDLFLIAGVALAASAGVWALLPPLPAGVAP
ncbi:MAG: hypothetical protein KGQ52_08180 [Alphaproteobacteria bacterium]|nr:hypothetical protein [Alphaproteobacteria bacterium]